MSKKFKSQASSARAANSTFGSPAFGFGNSGFQTSSSLSYVAEQPDLSAISDPNIVVSLRNLGKKDSTTKAKALEELQEYVTSAGPNVEDPVLTAWIALYPRTSIDNSRRVRQLAHTLQGSVTSATGKRSAPHLPKAVGSWICGLYDSDRAVARAAQEALTVSFQTEEKRNVLWEAYKQPLLEYAEDAILVQTSATLSDERSTSKDDAESKHARVVGSATYMLAELIRHSQQEKKPPPSTFTHQLSDVLANKVLWEYAYHSDPYLRRSACSLASLCASVKVDLDWPVISTAFLAKGLQVSQLGSNNQFSGALLALTTARSEIWTSDYSAKSASSKRLLSFLKRGSQRGPEQVWTNIRALCEVVPLQVLANAEGIFELAGATSVAEALKEGVSHSDEPRQNVVAGWSCYIEVCFRLQSQLENATDREKFYIECLAAIIRQYVDPPDKTPALPLSVLPLMKRTILHAVETDLLEAFSKLWSDLSSLIVDKMRMSLPETSRDFASSQEAILKTSDRIFKLAHVVRDTLSPSTSQVSAVRPAATQAVAKLDTAIEGIISATVDILYNRKGKPYGAAAVLQGAASVSDALSTASELLRSFLEDDASQLMQSPSAERLVRLTASLTLPMRPLLHPLISASELNSHGKRAFAAILNIITQEEAESFPELAALVVNTLDGESSDSNSDSALFASSVLRNPNLRTGDVVKELTEALLAYLQPSSTPRKQHGALILLQTALSDSTSASTFASDDNHSQLIPTLLVLSDSQQKEISELATNVLTKLKAHPARNGTGKSATASIVAEQLSGSQPQLPILSLVELAIEEFNAATDKQNLVHELLPTIPSWTSALEPHLCMKPASSCSITSPLQGAVYAVSGKESQTGSVTHDSEGFSAAFRLALYVTRLVHETKMMKILDDDLVQRLYENLPLALQLINEKLTLDSSNDSWIEGTAEVVDEAAEIISQGNLIIESWSDERTTAFAAAAQKQWEKVQDDSSISYYNAMVVLTVAARTLYHGDLRDVFPDLETDIKQLHRSDNPLRSATLASCARENIVSSTSGRKTLNELLSAATEIKTVDATIMSLSPVILLNIILNGEPEPLEGIQSQRLVFLMQNLVRLLMTVTDQPDITSEIFKLLSVILPAVQDIYGEQWQQVLDKLVETWESIDEPDSDLPLLHSSFRLYQRVKALTISEEVNEDLTDAWAATKPRLDAGLLQCLWSFEKPSTAIDQPRQITAELLGRMLGDAEVQAEEIVPTISLMAVEDDAVVGAAYSLLHRAIPKRQEDLAMELALEKQTVHLPQELLSIITDGTLAGSRQPFHSSKRYLLCWKLVLDHFPRASHKLREAYTTDIKEAGQLPALLDSICETVRITSGRPLDVSRLDFEGYVVGNGISEAHELQHLSVHIYYCCLLYIPGLVKTWYIEQKNRIRSPLESWTQKYTTPSICSASLTAAVDWTKTQDQDDNPVEVKINVKSRELIASMAIDPESPPISIAIALPASFPLDSPTVTGRTRVGVSEKNWQAWTRTFQIIIFSTGSIVEGIIAFRRNVQGALKGHGECAICYSIIGTDMQTPNKKCGTCKNQFHGVCLFRWFKSSNSSSCPLCRNNFNYA